MQLINKINQFNLTTRRYTEEDVLAVMADPDAFGLQLRLLDRFGDNGDHRHRHRPAAARTRTSTIDTWLMSCRVLGRQVEPTTLNLIAQQAQALGARRLVGEYIPTKKNGMVKEPLRRSRLHRHADGRGRRLARPAGPGRLHAGGNVHSCVEG